MGICTKSQDFLIHEKRKK